MSNSIIILENQSSSVVGDKYKGDGYYGRSDGFHTVQLDLDGFTGTIKIQGTLAVEPTDSDWFPVSLQSTAGSNISGYVDTTGAVISTNNSVSVSSLELTLSTETTNYNFVGNYVWIRAIVEDYSAGTINSIRLNH